MNKEYIEYAIRETCRLLYIKNKSLIDERAHERTIVNEMLPCFRGFFIGFQILSEYNREGEIGNRQPKTSIEGTILVPDIIVHQPGPTGQNLLAIEVKGYWNSEPRVNDEIKLKKLRIKHGYEFLYRIELEKDTYQLIEVTPDYSVESTESFN